MTVLTAFGVAGVFTLAGIQLVRIPAFGVWGPLASLVNLANAHVLSLFMHEGLCHYLGNMVLFLLFGGVLTALTSDECVLVVILAAHVPVSILFPILYSAHGVGASLAVAGLIAATFVRAAAVVTGCGDADAVRAILGGAIAVLALVLYTRGFLTGSFFCVRITDHHLGGWIAGGLAEALWLVRPEAGTGG
ncbi:rhomboid family intramembrane serine protease [Halorientalis regularis]|uniref:Rhomboid family protein n=1 Tax=Halorientalis regularis TaxID=660518 RepID=A0A1G7G1E7_9EURY|nr:rhomboid family intramembrane serine protease [Halorientalis regularis]SDE81938.1 Rhomboid family protein [Halorientalis regularis]